MVKSVLLIITSVLLINVNVKCIKLTSWLNALLEENYRLRKRIFTLYDENKRLIREIDRLGKHEDGGDAS